MEGGVDHIRLLLARETHEVDGVTGDPDGEVRVLLRLIHGIHQRLAIQYVHVHVVSGHAIVRVEHGGEVSHTFLGYATEPGRHQRDGEGDAVLRIAIRNLCDRCRRSVDAVAVTSVHRVGAGGERLAFSTPVGRVAGTLAVHDIR